MLEFSLVTLVIIGIALIFDFSNGLNDSANAIATVVSTRVLSPVAALGMAVTLNFFGAYMNTEVAQTIGKDIVDPVAISSSVIIVALSTAAAWNILLTIFGMPVSASHALIGGLVGAVMGSPGNHSIHATGLTKILLALLISPPLALACSLVLMNLVYIIFRHTSATKVNKIFGKLQILSAAFMAFSHGSNDAQKSMGVITMALVAGGYITTFHVPGWVVFVCAAAMAMGTAFGGWRVIHTLGVGLMKLKPVHGFGAESSAALVIMGASHFGLPVSTTHVITSTVVGVGSARRASAVRWGLASKIIVSWVLTLPVCIGVAAMAEWIVSTWLK
ncbi:MAG: anion permease [Candidatus Zixiibacteriota bacterium]|nr:MAG: anion permease [candidate division Zixibacteria bacterium]